MSRPHRTRDVSVLTTGQDAYIALTEVPPILGKKVHLNTLRRWATSGVRGIKLRTNRVGGRRWTTRRWVEEFLAALNPNSPPPRMPPNLGAKCLGLGV